MANYTIELRRICDLYGEDNVKNWFYEYNIWDYLTEDQVRDINHYNVWSPERLARKIIDHYYFREIGFETPGMFHHFAKVKMQELMEKYLPIIWSTTIEYNPLHNVDYTETYEKNTEGEASDTSSRTENVGETRNTTNSGTSSSTASDNSSGLNVKSDTPQGRISKLDILSGSYASETQANENTSSSSSTTTASDTSNTLDNIERTATGTNSGTSSGKETFTRRMVGNSGVMTTAQKLIEQYRNIIVTIDNDIIKELDSLFIGLF